MASQTYTVDGHSYASWQSSLGELRAYAEREGSAVRKVLAEVTAFFQQRPQTSANYGLTHGDHRKGNVLSDGSRVTIAITSLQCFAIFRANLPGNSHVEKWATKVSA